MQVYFKTFGCAVNQSESEIMKGLLKKADCKITKNPDKADYIILNICTVKGNKTALKAIRNFRDKKLIVAGCISKDIIPEIKKIKQNISLINTHNIAKIAEAIKAQKDFLSKTKVIKLNLPRIRKNKLVSIIPISSGCSGSCSYCSVKLVKGDLLQYPENKIIKEVKTSLNEGCKELWITAQDVASYKNLPALLNKITQIPKDFKIRIGMMNPNNVLPVLDQVVQVYKSDKIYKFLHLPLQSASNKLLKSMNREYTKQQFKTIIDKFRKNFKSMNIATDIIVGFPGETDSQFKETLDFIKQINPDSIFISKFRPRPGTNACKMKQLPDKIIKQRSKALLKLFQKISLNNNRKWIGWQGPVIVEEKNNKNSVARNFAYKPVLLDKNLRIGQKLNVKIIDAVRFGLVGKLNF